MNSEVLCPHHMPYCIWYVPYVLPFWDTLYIDPYTNYLIGTVFENDPNCLISILTLKILKIVPRDPRNVAKWDFLSDFQTLLSKVEKTCFEQDCVSLNGCQFNQCALNLIIYVTKKLLLPYEKCYRTKWMLHLHGD